jgi:hypothetical protein
LELDRTYRAVAARLPENPAVRFETVNGKEELILSTLDKLDEPASLKALRKTVKERMPLVDLPEITLVVPPALNLPVPSHMWQKASPAHQS